VKAAAAAAALCAACASYRLLPLPAGPGPMPVRYEKSRLFFHSQEEDGALARVFAGPSPILATVAAPEQGVFSSADGGATWAYSPAPPFDAVLFGGRSIFAVAGGHVLHSEDQGASWEGGGPGEAVEALALGPAGTLYAAGRGKLYASADGGRTFRALAPQLPAKSWRVRSIVAAPAGLFLSVHGDPMDPRPPQARLQALLGYASTEAVTALALVDSRDTSARTIQWGTAGDGAYLSVDGGATFRKTGLMLDAWLVAHDGALYAVAADPVLQAAGLIRRYPDLAAAAERHLNGDRGAAATLREACAFPGRKELVAGPIASAPIFRSTDSGATWARVLDPPLPLVLALREGVERSAWEAPPAPAPRRQQGGGSRPPPPDHQRAGGRHGGRAPAQGQEAGGRAGVAFPLVMLALVDPARLLAHYNSGLQLSGVSNGDAYLPTQPYWEALLAAAAAESEAEGEISLGPGLPDFPQGAAFEILRLDAAGELRPVAADLPRAPPGIVAYPESMASAGGQDFFVLAGRGRRGQSWRGGWRTGPP
jgi:hypothetical protein